MIKGGGVPDENAKKIPLIHMKPMDIAGIALIKMGINFNVKHVMRTLIFCDFLYKW